MDDNIKVSVLLYKAEKSAEPDIGILDELTDAIFITAITTEDAKQ
jgi:hypothetical protein